MPIPTLPKATAVMRGACLAAVTLLGLFVLTPSAATGAEGSQEKFRFPMPDITPPSYHPRLLLTPEFIPELQQRIDEDELCAEAWETVCKRSESKQVRLPEDNQFSRPTLIAISSQALRYAVEGDEQMGKDAVANTLDMLSRLVIPDRHDVTRDYGEVIFTVSLVYDWCYPLMDAEQKQQIIDHIKELASHMEIGYPPYRQGAVTGHGGEAQLMRDLISAGIAVYDEDPSIYHHSAGRFFVEFIEPRNFNYQAHRHNQGISYGVYRFHWEIYSAWLFKRMAGVDVYSPDQGKMPYHWIYALCPDGSALIDGDTNLGGRKFNIMDGLMEVTSYYNDPYLHAESLRRRVHRFAKSKPVEFLLFYDPSVEVADLSELPTTKYFAEPLGSMIARTGWAMGRDSDVAVVEMKGAGYHFNNHMHLDAGAFQIYYRGHLAIDTGAYPKYGTPFDWNYNKRSISHNVMLAYDPDEDFGPVDNDGGQRFPNGRGEFAKLEALLKHAKSGSILGHEFGPNEKRPLYSYLRADLTPSYGDRLKSYQRHFVTLNMDDSDRPATVLVYDRMDAAKPGLRKIWLLQTLAEPVEEDGKLIVDAAQENDTGRMVVETLLPAPEDIDIETVGGPDGDNPVFDRTYPIGKNKHGSVPPFNLGYRTQIEDYSDQPLSTFLNVVQIMDREYGEAQPVERLSLDQMDGVALDGWQVYFPRTDAVVGDALAFSVTDGPAKVLMTGLKAGTWTLKQKGSDKLQSADVSEEATTLYMELKPGDYELSPGAPEKGKVSPLPDYSNVKPVNVGGEPPARVIVNGRRVLVDNLIFNESECYVDVVPIFQALKIPVQVDDCHLVADYNGNRLVCKNGEAVCTIEGQEMQLDKPLNWSNKSV
ncbi:MAG: hypothetical protein ACQKBW_05250, partial [Puniceicoccales bacterium]